jgi:flagellar hook-associated protein 2
MLGGISFSGIASGLDTSALISALVAAERRPLDVLQVKKLNFQDRLEAFDDLNSRLLKLQDELKKFDGTSEFLEFQTSLSEEDFLRATSTGSAAPGSYDIVVSQLAESSLLRTTTGYANADTLTFGAGTLTIQVGGDSVNVDITDPNATLLDLKDAINQSGAEVNASIIFDGSNYHLEVRGNETGAQNDVSITPSLSGGTASPLAFNSIHSAQDASLSIDGLAITSSDNTIEDAISGISLSLLAVRDTGNPGLDRITLTVGEDLDATEAKIQDFLSAYNNVISFLNTQSDFDPQSEDSTTPPLLGDSLVFRLRLSMGSTVASSVDLSGSLGLTFDSLRSLGISTTADGTLELDSSDLQDALSSNLDDVRTVFSDASIGFAAKLTSVLETRTDKIDGLIQARKEGIQTTLKNFDRQIERSEDRLELFEEAQVRKFAAFESLIGRLQTQGSFLSAASFSLGSR